MRLEEKIKELKDSISFFKSLDIISVSQGGRSNDEAIREKEELLSWLEELKVRRNGYDK